MTIGIGKIREQLGDAIRASIGDNEAGPGGGERLNHRAAEIAACPVTMTI